MQKFIFRILSLSILLYIFFFVKSFSTNTNTLVTVAITPWQITYGSPVYLNLWQINLSQTQQEIEWQFSEHFWISDLEASDNGYTTTIVSDGLVWANWIILTWIYLAAWNNGIPDLLAGLVWDVRINQLFSGNYFSINNPITYIYRPQWLNYWRISKYGDRPWIKIIVPPYAQPWTYSWTIYFDI
jgi:hypothetical protein